MKTFLTFLSRNKAYTLTNVFGLSLSMMFVILIGTYTWTEYHANSQFPKADRILVYGMRMYKDGTLVNNSSGGHWRLQQYFRSRYPEIESSTAIYGGKGRLELGYTDRRGQVSRHPTLLVDSTFLTMLDIPMAAGDTHTALADTRSAVVTEAFARRHFGSAQKAMGQQLDFDGLPKFRITGVMGATFAHSSIPEADILLRFGTVASAHNSSLTNDHLSNATGAEVLFLEKPGTHLEDKLADMDNFQKEFFWIFRSPGFVSRTTLTPLSRYYFTKLDGSACLGRGDQRLVNVLLAVGIVILLFAVFNYINLTNAISDKRAREMAMRRLVGATRHDIVWRLIGESVLLCVASMLLALLLAWAAVPYTERLLGTTLPLHLAGGGGVAAACWAAGLAMAFALLLGIMAGAIPASLISRAKPVDIVKGGSAYHKPQSSPLKPQTTSLFIVVQNVCTIVLIAMAFAMSAQIRYMVTAWRGYNTHNLIEVPVGFNGYTENNKRALDAWYDGLGQLPQVVATTACMGTPYNGGNNSTFTYGGRTVSSQVLWGDQNYMRVFGLKAKGLTGLRGGRGQTVYVNRRMLAEESLPMNSRYYYSYAEGGKPHREVVSGVLDDFILRGLDAEQHPLSLTIADSVRFHQWSTVVQVQGDPVAAYEGVRKVFEKVFREPLDLDTPFIDQQIAAEYAGETRVATILRLFALIATVISVLGLVAMSTYYIEDRRREIAIRKVFGSTSGGVSRRFVRRFLSYALVAFVIAAPLFVYFYSGWVAQYSHRAVWGPWLLVAGVLVLVVSYAAVAVQTWKASRENPARNLKQE